MPEDNASVVCVPVGEDRYWCLHCHGAPAEKADHAPSAEELAAARKVLALLGRKTSGSGAVVPVAALESGGYHEHGLVESTGCEPEFDIHHADCSAFPTNWTETCQQIGPALWACYHDP